MPAMLGAKFAKGNKAGSPKEFTLGVGGGQKSKHLVE